MPTPQDAAVRALRLKHKSACTAHDGCIQALIDAKLRGEQPSADLLKREAEALREVNDARANLLTAMMQSPGD